MDLTSVSLRKAPLGGMCCSLAVYKFTALSCIDSESKSHTCPVLHDLRHATLVCQRRHVQLFCALKVKLEVVLVEGGGVYVCVTVY